MQFNKGQARATGMSPFRRNGDIPVAADASRLGDRLELIKAVPQGSPKKEAKRKKKAGLADDEP
ncbi:MAG: hypothetical protein RL077_4851 [Verrucomicrobiota bacterium]|jgi:hypothetical protein